MAIAKGKRKIKIGLLLNNRPINKFLLDNYVYYLANRINIYATSLALRTYSITYNNIKIVLEDVYNSLIASYIYGCRDLPWIYYIISISPQDILVYIALPLILMHRRLGYRPIRTFRL